jgi:hypothetical protein
MGIRALVSKVSHSSAEGFQKGLLHIRQLPGHSLGFLVVYPRTCSRIPTLL